MRWKKKLSKKIFSRSSHAFSQILPRSLFQTGFFPFLIFYWIHYFLLNTLFSIEIVYLFRSNILLNWIYKCFFSFFRNYILQMYFIQNYILVALSVTIALGQVDFNYHNYDQFTSLLNNYANKYPTKTFLYSIGKSVDGKSILFIELFFT